MQERSHQQLLNCTPYFNLLHTMFFILFRVLFIYVYKLAVYHDYVLLPNTIIIIVKIRHRVLSQINVLKNKCLYLSSKITIKTFTRMSVNYKMTSKKVVVLKHIFMKTMRNIFIIFL